MNDRPTLLVRARLNPTVMEEFETWHVSTHLPHVLAIPGIVAAHRLRGTRDPPGTHLMLFEFRDQEAVQSALASEEAQRARRDWDRWMGELHELSIEIYAPLEPMAGYHHRN